MNIQIRHLTIRRGNNRIPDDLSLNIASKTITAINGHNGSGKSTLLRSIAGLLKPESGKIFYGETDIAALTESALARCRAVVLQNPHIPENMRVNELLFLGRFARNSGKKSDSAAVEKALADTGCTHLAERKTGTLSGGELRKIFLALALVQEPEILLLDELETNLDAAFRRDFPMLLKKLQQERSFTVVMVSHDLDLALHCADRLIGLDHGKMVLDTPLNTADAAEKIRQFAGENFEIFSGNDGFLRALPKFTVN